MTLGCARCHDHKYDPLRMKDCYQLVGFFNNIDGPAFDGNAAQWAPIVKVPTAELKSALEAADRKLAALRQAITAEAGKAVAAYDGKADAERGKVLQRADFVWVDDAVPQGASPSFFYPSRNLITLKCFRHEAGGSIDHLVIMRSYLQDRIYQFFLGIRTLESC